MKKKKKLAENEQRLHFAHCAIFFLIVWHEGRFDQPESTGISELCLLLETFTFAGDDGFLTVARL